MNVSSIIGFFSLVIFVNASLFKTMHWPGGGVMMLFGLAIFIVFALLWLLLELKKSEQKAISVLGSVGFTLLVIGMVFKVQYWPGATAFLTFGSFLTVGLFLPILIVKNIKASEIKMTLQQIIAIACVMVLIFTKANNQVSRDSIQVLINNSESLYSSMETLENTKVALPDSALNEHVENALTAGKEARTIINSTKSYIIQKCEGIQKEIADTLTTKWLMRKDEISIPSNILVGDPVQPNQGEYSATAIKIALENVNNTMERLYWKETYHPKIKLEGDAFNGYYSNWETENFYNTPLVSVVQRMEMLDLELLTMEKYIKVNPSVLPE